MLMCVVQALMVSRILWAELLFELFTQLVFRHPLGLHFHLHTLAAFDLNRHFADERVLVETCATFFFCRTALILKFGKYTGHGSIELEGPCQSRTTQRAPPNGIWMHHLFSTPRESPEVRGAPLDFHKMWEAKW